MSRGGRGSSDVPYRWSVSRGVGVLATYLTSGQYTCLGGVGVVATYLTGGQCLGG